MHADEPRFVDSPARDTPYEWCVGVHKGVGVT